MGLLWEEEGSQSNTADILQTLLDYLVLPFYRIIKTLFKTLLWEECSQSNNAARLGVRCQVKSRSLVDETADHM